MKSFRRSAWAFLLALAAVLLISYAHTGSFAIAAAGGTSYDIYGSTCSQSDIDCYFCITDAETSAGGRMACYVNLCRGDSDVSFKACQQVTTRYSACTQTGTSANVSCTNCYYHWCGWVIGSPPICAGTDPTFCDCYSTMGGAHQDTFSKINVCSG